MNDGLFLSAPDDRAPKLREAIFQEVLSVHEAQQHYNQERSRAGWWVGGIGAAIGLIGVASAAVMAANFAPVARFTVIDESSGTVRKSFGAKDAPDLFTDRVTRRYLTEYVELRERFVWQIDNEADHRVKIMSSPAEQARYAADRAKESPMSRYGLNGYARVTKFVNFQLRSKGKDKTFEYDVQFVKSEVLASNLTAAVTTRMTARIVFQFHPELKMADQDRLHNEAGLMVISYSANPD